jgi:hypothetical protein
VLPVMSMNCPSGGIPKFWRTYRLASEAISLSDVGGAGAGAADGADEPHPPDWAVVEAPPDWAVVEVVADVFLVLVSVVPQLLINSATPATTAAACLFMPES